MRAFGSVLMIPYHADRIAQRVLICCTIQRTIVPVSAREHADARRRSLGATTFPLKGVLCYACRTPAFGRNPVESLRLRIQLACFRHARLLASASALGRAVRIVGHLRRVRVGTNVSRIPLVPSSPLAPFSHTGRRGVWASCCLKREMARRGFPKNLPLWDFLNPSPPHRQKGVLGRPAA